MLVFVTGYSLAYNFLTLPFWYDLLSRSALFLTYLTFSWFLVNLITVLFSLFVVKGIKLIRTLLIVIFLFVSSVLFLSTPLVLAIGAVLAVLFYFLIHRIASLPTPGFVQLVDEHKTYPRLIQIHLFLSPKMTGEKIERTLNLIKEAIADIKGTGEERTAIFCGFAPSGLDILIKYYIVDHARLDQIKNDVNLTIVKKLNEAGIELGSIG